MLVEMLKKEHKILIAGSGGMVGSALIRAFEKEGYLNLITPDRGTLDYTDQAAVRSFLKIQKPDIVIVAAAKVGGIFANMSYPAEFIYNNLMIGTNLIHEAHQAGIKRLLYLGSTCIYPALSLQPIQENSLLTGPLEKTNEAYAIAKIAGIKLCQYYRQQYGCRYIAAMPTNLYGLNDNYHPENSHVIPALIGRFHHAKKMAVQKVVIWGSGKASREFLYVDDLANACLHLLKVYDEPSHINVGSNEEYTIKELAEKVAKIVGYSGKIIYDSSKPDGMLRKKSDTSRINGLGWRPLVTLEEGLRRSYDDFLSSQLQNS